MQGRGLWQFRVFAAARRRLIDHELLQFLAEVPSGLGIGPRCKCKGLSARPRRIMVSHPTGLSIGPGPGSLTVPKAVQDASLRSLGWV